MARGGSSFVFQGDGAAILPRQGNEFGVAAGVAHPENLARLRFMLEHLCHVNTFAQMAKKCEMNACGNAQASIEIHGGSLSE